MTSLRNDYFNETKNNRMNIASHMVNYSSSSKKQFVDNVARKLQPEIGGDRNRSMLQFRSKNVERISIDMPYDNYVMGQSRNQEIQHQS